MTIEGSNRLTGLAEQLHNRWPKLRGFVDETSEDVLAYLTFPVQHRAKLHSTKWPGSPRC